MTNTITISEIKDMLVTKYGDDSVNNHHRPLIIQKTGIYDAITWLSGSPPKGYCISGNGVVSLYDIWGKRFKILHNTRAELGDIND